MDYASNASLKKLQASLLNALCEFDRICTRASCNYSLMCGTLLGAVRHKGFIPWDDDVDIVMFRKDYNQFKKYCRKNINTKAYLDEKDTWVPRIRINDDKNVFVDIFILDKVSPSRLKHKFNILRLKLLQGMMKKDPRYERYSGMGRILVFTTGIIGRMFSFDTKYRLYHSIAEKYNESKSTKYYIADGAFSVIPLIWDKRHFERYIKVPYCDKSFLITTQYKSVLTKLYGSDYMQLPPEEKRLPTHV